MVGSLDNQLAMDEIQEFLILEGHFDMYDENLLMLLFDATCGRFISFL